MRPVHLVTDHRLPDRDTNVYLEVVMLLWCSGSVQGISRCLPGQVWNWQHSVPRYMSVVCCYRSHLMELTEHVLWKAVIVLFRDINCRWAGELWRNFRRTVGLPRGANEGLEELEDVCGSRLEVAWESSPASPIEQVSDLAFTVEWCLATNLRDTQRAGSPQIWRTPWSVERYLKWSKAIPTFSPTNKRRNCLGVEVEVSSWTNEQSVVATYLIFGTLTPHVGSFLEVSPRNETLTKVPRYILEQNVCYSTFLTIPICVPKYFLISIKKLCTLRKH
jgi:hypothetical protein